MASDRVQKNIERLLDGVDEAIARRDWTSVRDYAQDILARHSILTMRMKTPGTPIPRARKYKIGWHLDTLELSIVLSRWQLSSQG